MVAKALATICTRGQLKAKCRDWLVLEEIVSEDVQYMIKTWIYVDWKYEVVIISSNYFFIMDFVLRMSIVVLLF